MCTPAERVGSYGNRSHARGAHDMRVNRRLLSWGVFLILAGAIPLAVRAGWLTNEQIAGWWNLWPLVLIGIGVGIVLSRTPFEVIGNLIVGGTFGLMLGSLLAVGISGFPGNFCGGDVGSSQYAQRNGSFDGAADVSVVFNCGELELTASQDATWSFNGSGQEDRAPTVEADGDSLRIRSPERAWVPFSTSSEHWQIGLPAAVPLGLQVQLNAGSATVRPGAGELRDVDLQANAGSIVADLAQALSIGSLNVQANAGSARVTLPDESMSGQVQVNAGSIEVCIPSGAGVRIQTGGGLSGNNFADAGLVQTGNTWESSGFAVATTQIELQAEANLGSITLNPTGGCGDA